MTSPELIFLLFVVLITFICVYRSRLHFKKKRKKFFLFFLVIFIYSVSVSSLTFLHFREDPNFFRCDDNFLLFFESCILGGLDVF